MGVSICKRCGYKWVHPNKTAPRCPSCKAIDYDSEPEPISCNRSGGICDICKTEFLVFGIGKDKFCPNCGSEKWSNKKLYECLKCGHQWYSVLAHPPSKCSHREYYTDNESGARKIKRCTSKKIAEVKLDA